MRDFLNEYITSLTKKRRERVQDILSAAQVGKVDLDEIANQLVDLRISSPISIGLEAVNGIIESAKLDGTYNDAFQRIQELFEASNLVSLLLDTHTSMLTSEIKAIEDEINAIEKNINNYAFTLSDGGFYDYAFSETFFDQTMDGTTQLSTLTDRDGTNFSEDQLCYINTNSGILTLDPDLTIHYPIQATIIEDNCLPYVTTSTQLNEAFNLNSGTGWKINVSSQRPISTSLLHDQQKGAQVKVSGVLDAPSPCDTIVITPLADSPVRLLSMIVVDEDNENTKVINETKIIDKPTVISFPLQPVARFEFIISQPIYNRNHLPPNANEEIHRKVYTSVQDSRKSFDQLNRKSYSINRSALQRIFLKTTQKFRSQDQSYAFKAQLPKPNFLFSTGPLSFDRVKQDQRGQVRRYKNTVNNVIRQMIHERVFASNPEVLNDRYVANISTAFLKNATKLNANLLSGSSQEYPRVNVDNPIDYSSMGDSILSETQYLNYDYNLGIRNFEIGTGLRNYKGVFISKQLPSFTDAQEIKVKTNHQNYDDNQSARDSKRITNIEYSVTNKSNPKSESDWIPILPIDEPEVRGERLFFNEAGIAFPRFIISTVNEFSVYKNGFLIDAERLTLNETDDGLGIKSIRLPLNEIFVTDIFTVDYTTFETADVINFKDKGFDNNNITSAYDEFGGGETFSNTGDNNIISLRNQPYIDYDQISTFGGYSELLGFTGTYQPITIIMHDGTVATNFTNYNGLTQVDLSLIDASVIGYLQSGNHIIFNQVLNEQFTVFYQYLPSYLRLRTVMRCNDINYVTPIVDSYQLKAKTRKADPRKVF